MPRFNLEETIRFPLYIYGVNLDGTDGSLVNPSTTPTIQISDPDGTEVLAETAMTNSATGIYYYDYSTASLILNGTYQVKFTAIDGSYETIEYYSFELGR